MSRFTFPVFALMLIANLSFKTPAAADGKDADLTGFWKVKTSFGGRGGRTSIIELKSKNGELSGSMLSSQGGKTPLQNIQHDDGKFSFELTREWNGRRFTTPYSGEFDGITIRGTAEFRRRGTARTFQWEATRTTSGGFSGDLAAPPVAADIDLNDENYQAWRDHILPESSELAWEQIAWLTTFQDGILAAHTEDKPLLLWTMNGHPLGCT